LSFEWFYYLVEKRILSYFDFWDRNYIKRFLIPNNECVFTYALRIWKNAPQIRIYSYILYTTYCIFAISKLKSTRRLLTLTQFSFKIYRTQPKCEERIEYVYIFFVVAFPSKLMKVSSLGGFFPQIVWIMFYCFLNPHSIIMSTI